MVAGLRTQTFLKKPTATLVTIKCNEAALDTVQVRKSCVLPCMQHQTYNSAVELLLTHQMLNVRVCTGHLSLIDDSQAQVSLKHLDIHDCQRASVVDANQHQQISMIFDLNCMVQRLLGNPCSKSFIKVVNSAVNLVTLNTVK